MLTICCIQLCDKSHSPVIVRPLTVSVSCGLVNVGPVTPKRLVDRCHFNECSWFCIKLQCCNEACVSRDFLFEVYLLQLNLAVVVFVSRGKGSDVMVEAILSPAPLSIKL